MKTAIVSSVLALGLLSVACGKDNNNGQTIENIPSQLAGTYKTDCTKNSLLGLTSTDRQLSFSRVGDFDRTEVYYSGAACDSAPALTYKVSGTVQEQGKLPADKTLDMLNFAVSKASITPGTDALVTAMNTTRFCGKADWAINTEAQIDSVDCSGFTIKKGDVIQDVYDNRDGTLYFGKKFALLLKETGDRPTTVDADIPYHKQ